MAYKIDLLNAITAQLGGTTVHRYNINALNEWCTLAGGSGGHKYDIDAYNELATIYTGSGGFKFDIKALNAIVTELGGTAKTYTVDVLSQLGALLNQNEPEVTAYIAGLTTPLSSTQIGKLNTFVAALKTGLGISALSDAFDVMYILGGETAESSLKNLVKNAHHATAVNSPDFTALEGFTGNGTNSYINTGYRPNTHKNNYQLNSASIGIYLTTEVTSSTDVQIGAQESNPRLYIQAKYSGNLIPVRINDDGGGTLPTTTSSIGMTISSRVSASQVNVYQNKVLRGAINSASTLITNNELYILRADVKFSTAQASFALIGKAFSQEEVNVITDAFEAYMDSNGKGVIA